MYRREIVVDLDDTIDWSEVACRLEEHLVGEEILSMCGAEVVVEYNWLGGDVMLTEDWLALCDCGGVIDYDGYGYPIVTNAERRGYRLDPSEFAITRARPTVMPKHSVSYRARRRERLLANCRYVVWFNR